MASTDTLILLSKTFDSYFKRARNRARIMANNRRMARRGEKMMLPAAREMLDYIADEIRRGLPKLKNGKASAIKRMVDWEHIEEQATLIIKPAMLAVLAEGGKSIVERKLVKQERFDPIGVGAVNWASEHSAELVTGVVAETKKTIRTSVVAGINAGKSIPKIARELRPVVGLTGRQAGAVGKFATELYTKPKYSALSDMQRNSKIDRYARKMQRVRTETIARTETASALSEGTLQGYGQMGVNKVERIEDSDCCEICAKNNGRVYTLAMAEGVLPAHPNCLPGDSLVSPRGKITSVSKRWYDGEVIVIETASKRKLTCTPNHPILSDEGFCSANSLDVGSYVVSDGLGQRESFGYWKNVNKPTSIQEIAESFLKNRKMMTCEVPVAAPDFHNDGIGSKIAIVSTNRFLMNGFNPSFIQHFLNLQFKWRKVRRVFFDCLSMLAFGFPRNLSSGGHFMCSFNLMITLRLRHMIPKIFNGFALSPNLNIFNFQTSTDNIPGDMIFASKSFLRPSRNIQIGNFIGGKINMAKSSKLIPSSFLDKIIHIKSSLYHGYVYNLETTKSYYIANGIASHNCEGAWVAAVGEKLEPYEVIATGPRQAKITSLDDALKELPRRHVMRVEKYYIDTTSQINAAVPEFVGRDIRGYWSYADKAVHLNSKLYVKNTIFHEVGHAAYSTGIVPFPQKPLWKAWYQKATAGQIKYPSQYALTNEGEFFAECYSHYYLKKYHLIDDGIKKWFDKTFKGG